MRKLATASISFSVAIFLAAYFVLPKFYIACAIGCGLASAMSFTLKGEARRRTQIITLASALGFLVCFVAFQMSEKPAAELDGMTLKITAEIMEIPKTTAYGSSIEVKLKGDNVPHVRALIYLNEPEIPTLAMGDIVSLEARLKTSAVKYGEDWSGYMADNVFLICYAKSNIEIVGHNITGFLNFPKSIAASIQSSALKVFSSDTGAFLVALLTGEKSLLYKDVQLNTDMSEAGILHVVSVSGMHVAFLIGFLRLIIRRKKWVALIGIPLVWLFVPLAGASPSVIRAAFMQSMVLVAVLLKRENDGITAISTVMGVLLLLNPYAIKSISLQLSFAAMLGIILVTPRINRFLLDTFIAKPAKAKTHEKPIKRWWHGILVAIIASISASVGAIIFSTPIAALYFGFVPIYGILVNIFIFWAISVAFLLGYLACIAGLIFLPLGAAIGAVASLFGRYIIFVAETASKLPYAAVYTKGNLFGLWLVLIYGLFIGCYIFKGKSRFRPILPISITICTLCALIIFTGIKAQNSPARLRAVNVGEGQSIVVTKGRSTIIIDCSGRLSTKSSGDLVALELLGQGRRSVDLLAVTSLSENGSYDLLRLMSRVDVKKVLLPPLDENDEAAAELLRFLKEKGAEVYIITEDSKISIGGLQLFAYAPISRTAPALMFLIGYEDFECFVPGNTNIEGEKRFLMTHTLPDCEVFVAAYNGAGSSNGDDILGATSAEVAIISSGYNPIGNSSGDAIARIKAAGMEIFRTDQIGSITISMEK